MSEFVCCPLQGGGDEGPSFSKITTPRARKEHRCVECRDLIPIGTVHEKITAVWDGMDSFDSMRTCMSCVEIRNHFACGKGWVFGEVWNDLKENFFPNMTAGGPCMQGLSPAAKQRLIDLRMKWLEDIHG